MARITIFVLVTTLFFAACGPKAGSKITIDAAKAKAKYGSSCNVQELTDLTEAAAIKNEGDKLLAEAEEQFTDAKEQLSKAEKEEAKEKKEWFTKLANKAFEKGYATKIEAQKKYETANKKAINAYRSAITRQAPKAEEHVQIAAEEPRQNVTELENEAKLLRQQATAAQDQKTKSQLLAQASEMEDLAIDAQRTVLKMYTGEIKIEKPAEKIEEPVVEEPVKVNVVKKVPVRKITYKIQIAASRVELTRPVLIEKYSGDERINNALEDGWYKYSIGKFSTYAEAQAFKEGANVPDAFIIAYKENEKILLPEIAEKVKRGEMEDPRKKNPTNSNTVVASTLSGLVYKVQIAATQIPARPSQVKQMYHGQQIVSIHQSKGWYKYTLGYFDTREKAENLRAKAGVPNSFVVAYKNGKEIPLDR